MLINFKGYLGESFHVMPKEDWEAAISNKINIYLKLFPHIKITVYLKLENNLGFFLYSVYILISYGVFDIIMAHCQMNYVNICKSSQQTSIDAMRLWGRREKMIIYFILI